MSKQWLVVGRGFNGWHAKAQNVSSSGGSLEDYTSWTGEKRKGYLSEACEGAFVYDASHLETVKDSETFIRWVFQGPLIDFSLSDSEMIGKSFSREGPIKEAFVLENASPMTWISLGNWIKMFSDKVPGLKYGYVRNGSIVWEN